MRRVIFLGNARCYHTMDWYRNAVKIYHPTPVLFVTDLIDGEGHTKLVTTTDRVIELVNIDRLLLKSQSQFGNIWRNVIKLIVLPWQIVRLRDVARANEGAIFHAHAMYYMLLCWAAGVSFVGTPQGSEILVRPRRSRLYRYFAHRALRAAEHVTVDSVNMQRGVVELSGRTATVVQNGIDVSAIQQAGGRPIERRRVISIRGFHPLYRIDAILAARASGAPQQALSFVYPFWEDGYKAKLLRQFGREDVDLGRLPRTLLYETLAGSKLAISIPASDSSPRTVYEAVFCGCCVAVTHNPWIDILPACMRRRLFSVELDDPLWLARALEHANALVEEPYVPSSQALELFDQYRSMELVARSFY